MAQRGLDYSFLGADSGNQANPLAPAPMAPAPTDQPQPTGPTGSQQNPNAAWLRQYSRDKGWSEDFARFDDPTLNSWLQNYWDPNQGMFRTDKTDMQGGAISGWVEKPPDTPTGWEAYGPNGTARQVGQGGDGGGGGGFGGGGGGWGGGGFQMPPGGVGAPLVLPEFKAPTFTAPGSFQAPKFVAPTGDAVFQDPGYQFRLKQGQGALESSAAARGVLRTGGTLKDILNYGQDYASQEYGNAYNRALQSYGTQYQGAKDESEAAYKSAQDQYAAQYQAAKDEYAPGYASALSNFGRQWDIFNLGTNVDLQKALQGSNADLQKYLQKQGFINNLLMPQVPQFPGYTG